MDLIRAAIDAHPLAAQVVIFVVVVLGAALYIGTRKEPPA